MDWTRDGADWPNSRFSRLIDVRPHRWHVQEAGEGPTLLLLHGSGGATQSWRGLFPILAESFHVVAPDLPGQGFTRPGTRSRLGLVPMAEDIAALCRDQGWAPELIVGHSAGAAIALELADRLRPKGIVGINAALGKFDGIAGWLFPIFAKLLALNPLVPPLFTRVSRNDRRVRELLDSTGSKIDETGFRLYQRLISDRAHVDGTLAMMAQWRIDPLIARLPDIGLPVLLIVGENDLTVPPETSRRAAARLPRAEVAAFPGFGHLIHEEAPQLVADEIARFAGAIGAAKAAP